MRVNDVLSFMCLAAAVWAGIALLPGPALTALASESKNYVFSDVRHIVATDDYVGSEVVIQLGPDGKRVVGQWDLYQGYDPIPTPLAGTLVGSRLQMKGRDADGPVVLTAEFSRNSLRGRLKWQVGGKPAMKAIDLTRVACRLVELRGRGCPAAE